MFFFFTIGQNDVQSITVTREAYGHRGRGVNIVQGQFFLNSHLDRRTGGECFYYCIRAIIEFSRRRFYATRQYCLRVRVYIFIYKVRVNVELCLRDVGRIRKFRGIRFF